MSAKKTRKPSKLHQRLSRSLVNVSLLPGQPMRAMSAYSALAFADEQLRAGNVGTTAHVCRQLAQLRDTREQASLIMLQAMLALGRPRETWELTNELGRSPPQDLFGSHVYAEALRALNRQEEARLFIGRAIQRFPADPQLRQLHGEVLADMGEVEEACRAFRIAIRLAPDRTRAYRALAMFDALSDEELAALERVNVDDMAAPDRHAALAMGYRRRGEVDREFACLDLGNRLLARRHRWSREQNTALVRRVTEIFDEAFFGRTGNATVSGRRPIFVMGMPRSGSSLVEQILCSTGNVTGIGESLVLRWIVEDFSLARMRGVPFPDYASLASDADLAYLAGRYLATIAEVHTTSETFVDKQLESYLFFGLLAKALPEARFVHTVRHPLDCILSAYQQVFASVPFANSLEDLAIRYRDYTDLMAHWNRVMPGRIYTVHYENLVAQPEAEVRALLEHCGLPWDTRALEFHASRQVVKTTSAAQVRQPIYASSVGKWRQYATQLQPAMEILGLRPGD